MTYYMTLLIGWLRPYLSLLVNPYFAEWLCPYLGSNFVHFIMDGCTHTTYHVSEISVVFVLAGLPMEVFSVERVLIKHFTPPSLLDLML